MKKSEIFNRRQQVWYLYTQGYTQEKMAQKQGMSLRTISSDLKQLKNEAREWFDSLPGGELQVHSKSNFDSIQRIQFELWKLFETTDSENTKIKILSTIALIIKSSEEITINHTIKNLELIHKSLKGKTISESIEKLWRTSEMITEQINNGKEGVVWE